MPVTFILSLFREDMIRALFWTLVHSLWQGLALAILTGVVILFTRRSVPRWRYNILLGLFCLFLVGAGVTFLLQMQGASESPVGTAVGNNVLQPVLSAETPVMSHLYAGDEQAWPSVLESYFNRRANIIVGCWVMILFIRMVKLLVNLGNVQRLRHHRTSLVDAYWQERVKALANRLGIKRAVGLLESSIISVPMMAGVFKPVILVPLGLLSQLPPQQVEAILLHELAHIRRKDYFVNILQSIAVILFFFNPAVLWISALIREERENCCDDVAVGETRSKKEFIHALVSFQEYKQSSSYALAFPGSKNHLLQRVKRIVHNDNKTLNIPEKVFLLICVFITAGLTMAYPRQAIRPAVAPSKMEMEMQMQIGMIIPWEPLQTVCRDTSKPTKHGGSVNAAKLYEPVLDTAITPHQRRELEQLTQQQQAKIGEQQKRLEEATARLAAQEKELTAQQVRLNDLYLEALARVQDLRDSVHGENSLGRLKIEQDRLLKMNELRLEGQHNMESLKLHENERMVRENQRLLELQKRLYEQREREQESQIRLQEQNDRMIKHITPVVEMLQDKKLITGTDKLSFSLDAGGLTVNGQKQPDEIFQSFKKAFLNDPQDYIRYEKNGKSESTSINQHKD